MPCHKGEAALGPELTYLNDARISGATTLDSHISGGGGATATSYPNRHCRACPGNPCPRQAPDLSGEARCRGTMGPRDTPEGDGRRCRAKDLPPCAPARSAGT